MAIAKGEKVLQYIPQRPPVVMIDTIEEATETLIVSELYIKPDNIFAEEGFLKEPGIIENMAQTIAAGAGYVQLSQGKPVSLGYIAAIRDMNIYKLPEIGQTLRTVVEVINEVMDVTIVKGRVFVSESAIADCEMRIFIQKTSS